MNSKLPALLAVIASLAAQAGPAEGTPAVVKAPNEGPTRTYNASPDEVFEAATVAVERLGLFVTRAPDASVFIASPSVWKKPVVATLFPNTMLVRVRPVRASEVEIRVDEEVRAGETQSMERINAVHEAVATAIGEFRSKKPVIPRQPGEAQADGVFVKQSDLATMKMSEDRDGLRAWALAKDRSKPVATHVWKLSGPVPPHFTAQSERRLVVLDGSVRAMVGQKVAWLNAGDFVLVPKAVRLQLDVGDAARATVFVVESPPVDDAKTVWLDAKPGAEPKSSR